MMKHSHTGFFASPLKNIAGPLVLIVICVMIVTHLIIFIFFTNSHKDDLNSVNQNLVMQQVLHVIQVISTTPPDLQRAIVNSVDIPNVNLNIAPSPEYKLRFEVLSIWNILEHLSNEHRRIQLSVKLSSGSWLNVSATVVPSSLTLQIVLLTIELLFAAAVLFYLWSVSRYVKPLKHFALAANRLGKDLHAMPLQEVGPSDVRRAARALNNMQDKLRSLIRERTQMLAAISHDLRTPITRLKLRSQFIQDEDIRNKNLHDLDEMNEMIKDTLLFAREDTNHGKMVRFEFESLLSALCDDLSGIYPDKLSYEPFSERLTIFGRPLAIKRAITNIIENAIKYGNSAHVRTRVDHEDDMVIVYIEDEGPGILEEDFDKVFSPFFRSEQSRSRETGGTGLGLAVARDIVRAHGGDVYLRNMTKRGLRVIVSLPIEQVDLEHL